MAKGTRTSQTAELLHIRVKTGDIHRLYMMPKLGLRSVAGLTTGMKGRIS